MSFSVLHLVKYFFLFTPVKYFCFDLPLIGHSKTRIYEEKNWFLNDLLGGKSKLKYFTVR